MRLFRFLLLLVPVLLYGTTCSNETDSALTTAPDSGGTTTGTGTLKLYLTDAPGEKASILEGRAVDTLVTVELAELSRLLLYITPVGLFFG